MAPTARAATVVLVRPARPSAVAAEATVRLRGELVSAGFNVQVIDPPTGVDVRDSLEQAAAGPDVEAVVAILGDDRASPVGDTAELWVIDRVTRKTVVRRVPNEPGSARAAEVLSIRALELLRASFLEVALAAGRAAKTGAQEQPPAVVTRFTEDAIAGAIDNPWRSVWAVEVGGFVLGSLEGMRPSLLPLVRLARRFGDPVLVRVTVAGLGTPSRIEAPSGTAQVSQRFGLIEGVWRWRVDKRLQPFVSAGAGALHFSVVGPTSREYQGLSEVRWALLADGGLGLRTVIQGRFEIALDVHVQAAHPYPVVRFLGADLAREGRPTLIGGLSLIAWM
ncbi:MAG: hypothetical protein ABUL77_04255 [Bacteroidota bacterium]